MDGEPTQTRKDNRHRMRYEGQREHAERERPFAFAFLVSRSSELSFFLCKRTKKKCENPFLCDSFNKKDCQGGPTLFCLTFGYVILLCLGDIAWLCRACGGTSKHLYIQILLNLIEIIKIP